MADNKLPVYANTEYEGVPFRLLLGLATVKNGQVIFERDDLNPAIIGPKGELFNAPVEELDEPEDWVRMRRPWEDNDLKRNQAAVVENTTIPYNHKCECGHTKMFHNIHQVCERCTCQCYKKEQ